MQELHLTYGQNKGKQYTEEEDRFLLVRLEHWSINREDVYELIKRDAGEWPLFRCVPTAFPRRPQSPQLTPHPSPFHPLPLPAQLRLVPQVAHAGRAQASVHDAPQHHHQGGGGRGEAQGRGRPQEGRQGPSPRRSPAHLPASARC